MRITINLLIKYFPIKNPETFVSGLFTNFGGMASTILKTQPFVFNQKYKIKTLRDTK